MKSSREEKKEEDLNDSLDEKRFEKLKKIGEGTYGKVYKAIDKITNKIVALKKMKLEDFENGFPSTALREISILKELNHQNVVKLYEVIYKPTCQKIILIFEYLEYDLKKYMEKFPKIANEKIKNLVYQLLLGIKYCHQHRIFHRDLKPQNLLISSEGILKIADFGLARAFSIPIATLTHEIETLWYRGPEILLGCKQYSLPVDIWSIGCIFAELIINKPFFIGDSEIDQIFKIFQVFGTPNKDRNPIFLEYPEFKLSFPQFKPKLLKDLIGDFDNDGIDLLKKMLELNPSQRINAIEALEHPYFDDIDKE